MAEIINQPFADYQKIPAISNTGLGYLAKTPAHYKQWLAAQEEDESDALRIGRIAHRAILEPDKFEAEFTTLYAVKPDGMKFSTKEGKEWKAAAIAEGREIITFDQSEFISAAVSGVKAHPMASKMLRSGTPEVSISAMMGDVPVKCRVDFLTTGNSIIDVKTARDASAAGFEKAVNERGYYRQAAFYLDVCEIAGLYMRTFCFVAIEKEPPYLVACYQLSEEAIEIGRREYKALIALYRHCCQSNTWPGYSTGLDIISLPEWRRIRERRAA